MDDVPDLVRLAGLLAEPARARILWMLIDGSTRPAGELAHGANISPQSATAHLSRLVEGGLLVTEAQGRHRYFRIPNAEVAGAIEGIATLSAAAWPRPTGDPLPVRKMLAAFVAARTCYGHLAGDMAVKLLAAMVKSGWLLPRGRDFEVSPEGEKQLDVIGIDRPGLRGPDRAPPPPRRRARRRLAGPVRGARLGAAAAALARGDHHATGRRELPQPVRRLSAAMVKDGRTS